MYRLIAALVAGLIATTLAAAPATAETAPTLAYPIHSTAAEVVVQVNAGPRTWNIRKAVRAMDAQIDGLTIRTSGDCHTADVCVDVRAGRYSKDEMLAMTNGVTSSWSGLTAFPTPRDRIIFLNTNVARQATDAERARIAAHEFGHVLGLAHHNNHGLMSVSHALKDDVLSADELTVLRAWYGNPQARA